MAQNSTVQLNIATTNTAKATKDVKSLKEQIRDLKNEMAGLAEDTEEYNQAAAQLGDLMHQQQEITEAAKLATNDYGQTLSNITSISAGAVGSLSALNGVMNLIGASSDEATEAMRKIQSLMAIVQGLNQLDSAEKAFKGLWTRVKTSTKATNENTESVKRNSTAETENAAATAGASTAMKGQAASAATATKANGLLSVSFKNLKNAVKSFMASNPFTLIIMAITTVISLVSSLVSKEREAAEEMERIRKEAEHAATLSRYSYTGRSGLTSAPGSYQSARDLGKERYGEFTGTQKEAEKLTKDIDNLMKKRQKYIAQGKDVKAVDKEIYELEMRQSYQLIAVKEKEYVVKLNELASEKNRLKMLREGTEEYENQEKAVNGLNEELTELKNSMIESANAYHSASEGIREINTSAADTAFENGLKKIATEYEDSKLMLERQLRDNQITHDEYYKRLAEIEQDYLDKRVAYLTKWKKYSDEEKLKTKQQEDTITDIERKASKERIENAYNEAVKKAEIRDKERPRIETNYDEIENDAKRLAYTQRYYDQQGELLDAWWFKKFELIEQYNQRELEIEREFNLYIKGLAMQRYDDEEAVLKGNEELEIQRVTEIYEAGKAKLDQLKADNLISEDDYNKQMIDLTREREDSTFAIEQEFFEARQELLNSRVDTEMEINQQLYEIEKEAAERQRELAKTYINAFSTVVSSIGGLMGDLQGYYDEGSKQYEALQEAQIVMSTITGTLAAWMSGIEAAPAPWNLGIAAAMSGIALAQGIIALDQLHKKKIGGLSAGASNAPSTSAYQTVAYETGAELQGEIQDQRVYVTETDISETVNRVNVMEGESTF